MTGKLIPMTVSRKVEDFRQRWVLVDTCPPEPLYQLPDDVPVKTKEWDREPLCGPGMEALAERLVFLKERGLTCQMVAKEFLRQRVAPLQFRKQGLWELEGADSRMRLRDLPVDEATLNHATWVLFGSREIPDLHGELRPLYDRS